MRLGEAIPHSPHGSPIVPCKVSLSTAMAGTQKTFGGSDCLEQTCWTGVFALGGEPTTVADKIASHQRLLRMAESFYVSFDYFFSHLSLPRSWKK